MTKAAAMAISHPSSKSLSWSCRDDAGQLCSQLPTVQTADRRESLGQKSGLLAVGTLKYRP